MTEDFAKKTRARNKPSSSRKASSKSTRKKSTPKRRNNVRKAAPKSKPPLWAWLLIGLLVVGFAAFLAKLSNKKSSTGDGTNTTKTEATSQTEGSSQVKFDFYEILKGQEVEITEQTQAHISPKANLEYLLQTGSFKRARDADGLRAQLLLLNLPSYIEKVTDKKQQQWHRVVVGPFYSRSKLAKARSVLASNEINSILLKRKKRTQ